MHTNLKFGKLEKGGWAGEIDIAAFNPSTKELVHIEASTDAWTWKVRQARFAKKFDGATAHFKELFSFDVTSVSRIAVVGLTQPPKTVSLGPGIEIWSILMLINLITSELVRRHPLRAAILENYPILRALQFGAHYGVSTRTA